MSGRYTAEILTARTALEMAESERVFIRAAAAAGCSVEFMFTAKPDGYVRAYRVTPPTATSDPAGASEQEASS